MPNDVEVPDPSTGFRTAVDLLAGLLLLSSLITLILYFCEKISKLIRKAQQEWRTRQGGRALQLRVPLLEEIEVVAHVERAEPAEQIGRIQGPENGEEVEQVMGSITFCYCCSNIILAFLWFQIFDPSVAEDYADFMAFMTLFCLYNCSFYQVGFKYYFLRYFNHKKVLHEIGLGRQRIHRDEQRQGPQPLDNQLDEIEIKFSFYEQAIQSYETRFEALERSIRENIVNSQSPLLISMNSKINALVNIASFSLAILPTLAGNLGCGYFGDWSIKWRPLIQNDGVIFYSIMGAVDVVMMMLVLIHLNEARENYRERLEALDANQNLTVEEKQERHYLRHTRGFVIAMTMLNLLFLAVNIYASQATKDVKERWTHRKWEALAIIHFASPAIQSFLLFLMKYFEPIPRGL